MEQQANLKPKQYGALSGVRALSAIGVALMHIMFNGEYALGGFVGDKVIGSFGELVFLFMTVSAFSMCCGYYDKIMQRQITPSAFYGRRIQKILPFFALLCILDFAAAPSKENAMEVFANMTLCFGLLPNPGMHVIGVGWFIGLIFVFYIAFPFFCTLIENKRRAWLCFAGSVIFSILCAVYFFDSTHVHTFDRRANILYSAPYFLAGGLIFKYKDGLAPLVNRFKAVFLLLTAGAAALFFWQGAKLWTMLPLFAAITVYALRDNSPVLDNRLMRFFSGISMEIYLCHMLFFRVVQKIGLSHLFDSTLLSYLFTVILTLSLATAFSAAAKAAFAKIFQLIGSKKLCQKN